MEQLALRRGIAIERALQDAAAPMRGDRGRLQQVLINLLSNAVKFSPDNSPVAVALSAEDGSSYHVVVRDQGIGIPEEEQERIFAAFYEVGSITKHSTDGAKFMGSGTGLGLAIVKGIVERHGGRVWVESARRGRDGRSPGSAFHVVLPKEPRIRWDDDGSAEKKDDAAGGGESSARGGEAGAAAGKKTVLVIDPDQEAVEIARMILEPSFEVRVARDGAQGLAMAFELEPEAVMLERDLEGLDGYRVCRVLRSQDETSRAAIAFVSESARDEEVRRCFACGADECIVKPFSSAELLEKVQAMIGRKSELRR
jgi:CheY-like chemotaxis protein